MSNSSRASLKKSLKQLDKERLIDIILGVCDFNQDAKCYIENFFTPQFEKASEKYKKIMDKEFYPWGGGDLNFAVCRKAIIDFAKLNPPVEMLADLKLYLAATESHFTQYGVEYGDFYDNILEDYESALEYIAENNLERHFEERIIKVYEEATGGYYFPESMRSLAESICWKLFEDDEEDLEIVEDRDEEEVDVSVEEEEKDQEIAQNNPRDKDGQIASEVSLAMEVGVDTDTEASFDLSPDVEIEEIQDQIDSEDPSEIEVRVDEVDDEDKLEISVDQELDQPDQIDTEDVTEMEDGIDNDVNDDKLEVSVEIEIPEDNGDNGLVIGTAQEEVILIDDYDDSDMDFGDDDTNSN